MLIDKKEAIIRKGLKALNEKDPGSLDEVFSPNYIDHTNHLQGLTALKQFYIEFFKDFPEFHREIEELTIKGDKVWVRYLTKLRAITDERFEITSIVIMRILEGKIIEEWGGIIQKMPIPKTKGELINTLR